MTFEVTIEGYISVDADDEESAKAQAEQLLSEMRAPFGLEVDLRPVEASFLGAEDE